jgi:4,5-DOPA dioxygenase extradiol
MAMRMPVLFVGHGSPLYAIQDNEWSRGFHSLSSLVPRPRAILMVSAHWFTRGTFITGNTNPKTIHDFYGFPRELYDVRYPAPGDVDLARQVWRLIGENRSELRTDWGLDHGAWSVLRWMYPNADIPVIQLSINGNLTMPKHFDLARLLAVLREDGVLIVGSGNVTHNLRDLMYGSGSAPAWAVRFDNAVKESVMSHDARRLLELWPGSEDARLAHPTPDHFLPIIYTAAVADLTDTVSFPIEGFDRSFSMRNILWGS